MVPAGSVTGLGVRWPLPGSFRHFPREPATLVTRHFGSMLYGFFGSCFGRTMSRDGRSGNRHGKQGLGHVRQKWCTRRRVEASSSSSSIYAACSSSSSSGSVTGSERRRASTVM
jgi:hypothetical protein